MCSFAFLCFSRAHTAHAQLCAVVWLWHFMTMILCYMLSPTYYEMYSASTINLL